MRQRIRQVMGVAGVLGLLAGPVAGAQEAGAGLKVGYVDVSAIFDGYGRTKAFEAQLESKGKQKEAELEGRLTELRKLREQLELLSEDARAGKAREIEEKGEELQRIRLRARRDLGRERDQFAQQIFRDIRESVEEYAQANGYSLILDRQSVLFGQTVHDVTADVLKHLNARGANAAAKAKP